MKVYVCESFSFDNRDFEALKATPELALKWLNEQRDYMIEIRGSEKVSTIVDNSDPGMVDVWFEVDKVAGNDYSGETYRIFSMTVDTE